MVATPEPVEIKEVVPTPPPSTKRKQKRFQLHKGRLPSAGVSKMNESLELGEKRLSMEENARMTGQQAADNSRAPVFNSMPKSVGSILKV